MIRENCLINCLVIYYMFYCPVARVFSQFYMFQSQKLCLASVNCKSWGFSGKTDSIGISYNQNHVYNYMIIYMSSSFQTFAVCTKHHVFLTFDFGQIQYNICRFISLFSLIKKHQPVTLLEHSNSYDSRTPLGLACCCRPKYQSMSETTTAFMPHD